MSQQEQTARPKESFPPKWMLVVAILAILVGTLWQGVRISAAERQIDPAPIFRFDNGIICVQEQPHSANYLCTTPPSDPPHE